MYALIYLLPGPLVLEVSGPGSQLQKICYV